MPSRLRSRLAMIALLATFLIPVATSSLRGLTHVITCEDEAEIPFTLVRPVDGDPVIISSRTVTRGEEEGVCGGLTLDMGVAPSGRESVQLRLPITNRSASDWRGTVRLRIGDSTLPVDIGEIPEGRTVTDTVELRVEPGEVDVEGSLLLGP